MDGVGRTVAPEGQAPAIVADAVAHEALAGVAARVLADRDRTDLGLGVVEDRTEADAFDVLLLGQAAEFREGGVDVDKLSERSTLTAGGLLSGHADQERCAGGQFEVGVLVPEAVFAELPAMVAPQDDDGVIGEAFLLERIENESDLGVHVADSGVVAVA